MGLIDCNDGLQPQSWCPKTTDEALPAVLGLLPKGPAWDAGRVPGLPPNQFWRSYAGLFAYTYQRLCAYLLEFHCDTLVESADQWAREFDLDNPCDAYGGNLCAKVTAIGGQTCEHFVEAGTAAGWEITCSNWTDAEPIAGCFQTGCTMLGPPPVLAGPIYNYPPDGESENSAGCFEVGCSGLNHLPTSAYEVVLFDCGNPLPDQIMEPSDSTGKWRIGFGNAYTWFVQVDIVSNPDDDQQSNAGNFMPGCTSLCQPVPFELCFLDQIKPAHGNLILTTT